LNRRTIAVIAAGLMLGSLAVAQTQPEKKPAAAAEPASELASAMAQRLGNDLHLKTVVGEPIKVGSVTLIPIMMVEVSFGGAGVAAPQGPAAGAPTSPAAGVDGFFMSGEARPLGFVAVTKKGTKFISVGKTPAK
jgi:uncharacterized spore protein YtfJ